MEGDVQHYLHPCQDEPEQSHEPGVAPTQVGATGICNRCGESCLGGGLGPGKDMSTFSSYQYRGECISVTCVEGVKWVEEEDEVDENR